MVTLDSFYAQMQAALQSAGADMTPPVALCPECGKHLPDCDCVVVAVIPAPEYSAGDMTAYDGRQVPEMVRRDDADWRRL